MKVLHIINSLKCGGAENLIKETLPVMKNMGISTDVLLLQSSDNYFEQQLLDKGIRIFKTNCNNIYNPRQVLKIIPYLGNYNLVHTHLFPSNYWTAFAAKISGSSTPAVLSEHNTHNRRRRYKWLRHLELVVYRHYKKIICISLETESKLKEWMPSIGQNIVTINNGVDISKFGSAQPYRNSEILNIDDSNNIKKILMVARFSAQKDHKTLLNALCQCPPNYHLILVGEGELKQGVMEKCKQLNLDERVHFLGLRDDIERIISSADIFVLSSHWEGFGLAAVEAMAGGLPTIASDVPGLSEVVKGAGIIFPQGDYAELAESIKMLAEDSLMYKAIQTSCVERAQDFGIHAMINKYINVYKQLVRIE